MIRNYRSQLPFGEDVLAQIRKDVLTRIEREQRVGRRWLGMFLRASLAASALLFLVSLPFLREPAPRVDVTGDELPVARAGSPIPENPAQLAARHSQPEASAPTPPHPKRARRRPVARTEPPPSTQPEVVRIELQTSDPDVRIIWFANQNSGDTR